MGADPSSSAAPTTASDGDAFAGSSASPEPGEEVAGLEFCGKSDLKLARVAERVARQESEGRGPMDAVELAFAMRAEGEPHAWPHAFTLTGPELGNDEVAPRLRAFADSFTEGGERRCGVARANGANDVHAVAVVMVDAHADLSPLPTRGRVGQWMRLDATLLVPADSAKVVVLGPVGPPRTVPTTLRGDRIGSTFALDHEGAFTVQVLSTPSGGPRPILEAMIFADVSPPAAPASLPAPGEEANAPTNDAAALARMIDGARRSESLPRLDRVPALDAIADAHARALLGLGRLAHDAGDGNPFERLERAGIHSRHAGENVGHAASLALAHRLLWESPSHRGNLLDPEFDSVGVAAVPGEDGTVWVCESFATLRQH